MGVQPGGRHSRRDRRGRSRPSQLLQEPVQGQAQRRPYMAVPGTYGLRACGCVYVSSSPDRSISSGLCSLGYTPTSRKLSFLF